MEKSQYICIFKTYPHSVEVVVHFCPSPLRYLFKDLRNKPKIINLSLTKSWFDSQDMELVSDLASNWLPRWLTEYAQSDLLKGKSYCFNQKEKCVNYFSLLNQIKKKPQQTNCNKIKIGWGFQKRLSRFFVPTIWKCGWIGADGSIICLPWLFAFLFF